MTDPRTEDGSPAPTRVKSFETTQWSTVLVAGKGEGSEAAAALEALCRAYWYPLYAYVRRRGYQVEEAQDLTQEFFSRLLAENWIRQADPTRGRFRSFLLGSLNHFLDNEWDRSHAAKRGGGTVTFSLDAAAETRFAQEPVSNLTPETAYEQHWAMSLLELVLARLREHYAHAGKAGLYDALNDFLSAEATLADCTRLGAQWGMTPGAVAAAIHRLREHFRELFRQEVARTVTCPEEIEDEMRALWAALE